MSFRRQSSTTAGSPSSPPRHNSLVGGDLESEDPNAQQEQPYDPSKPVPQTQPQHYGPGGPGVGPDGKPLGPDGKPVPPPPPPPPMMEKIKEISESDDDDDEEPEDPQFFLGAATTIGMACFLLFVFTFLTQYGETSGLIVYLTTFCGGFVFFLVPFFRYLCTSQGLTCCEKFLDGLFGGLPFWPPGTGVCFIYVCLALAVKNVTTGGSIRDKILVYTNVPVYMVLWLPLFGFMMHLQRQDVASAEAARDKARLLNKLKPHRTPKRWKVTLIVFRRCVVAFVSSCCISAFYVLPFFAFSWLCVGMYMAWEIHIAIPICVIVVVAVLYTILAICKPKIAKFPPWLLYKFFTLPLFGWSPRAGDSIPTYNNTLTVDRRVAAANRTIERANEAAAAGDHQKAKWLREKAEAEKRNLDALGAKVVDVPEEDVEEIKA